MPFSIIVKSQPSGCDTCVHCCETFDNLIYFQNIYWSETTSVKKKRMNIMLECIKYDSSGF